MMRKKSIQGRLALLAATLFWGSSFVILKNTLDNAGILWILAVRFSIAAALLAAIAGGRLRKMDRQSLRGSVLIGLCLAAAYIVQTYGLRYTTPGKNAFLTSTYCVLVPFLAWGVYRRRPEPAHLVAALLCLTGIGFVSLGGESARLNPGDILTLFCGFFYALQILLMERYVPKSDALCVSVVEFTAAALVCWAGTLLFESAPAPLTPSVWGSILYLSLACTALCFFLQAWGIQYTPASTAAVILSLEAVFGVLTSILFYHERLTVKLVIGFALIFLSVLIAETKPGFFHRK